MFGGLILLYHLDHILGFFFFAPLFDKRFNFTIYGKSTSKGTIEDVFDDILDSKFWPVSKEMFLAKINFKEINIGRMNLNNNILVETNIHPHPKGAYGYRIEIDNKIISYITDIEHPPGQPLNDTIHLARGSDMLIHESHFTPEDLLKHKNWGHSSWQEASMVAKSSNSKKLALYHFSPDYNDDIINQMEVNANKIFNNTIIARQGLTLKIQ